MRVCIVGAGDGGATAANQIRRLDREAQIDIFSKRAELGCPPCETPLVISGTVADATFMTDGSGTSIASGSMVTEIAKGKSVGEVWKSNQQDILNALGGLLGKSKHCALLAANTLKEAIRDYLAMKKEPWKKAYRKH